MTTIGDDEIKALEGLEAKGTRKRLTASFGVERAIVYPEGGGPIVAETRWDDDARLIVAAVNALPRLLARLREAEGERDRLRAALPEPIEDAINERVRAGDGVIAAGWVVTDAPIDLDALIAKATPGAVDVVTTMTTRIRRLEESVEWHSDAAQFNRKLHDEICAKFNALAEAAVADGCEHCRAGVPLTDCHTGAPTAYHGYAYNVCTTPRLRAALDSTGTDNPLANELRALRALHEAAKTWRHAHDHYPVYVIAAAEVDLRAALDAVPSSP